MSSDSDEDAGQAVGAAIGVGLVVGQMRKLARNLVAAITPGLTQGEKLLVVAPGRRAGLPLKWLGVVLTDRRLIVYRAAVGGRVKGVLLDVPRGQVSAQRFRSYPVDFGASLVLRFDETVGHGPLKLVFNAYSQRDAEALRDALTGPGGDVTA